MKFLDLWKNNHSFKDFHILDVTKLQFHVHTREKYGFGINITTDTYTEASQTTQILNHKCY